MKSSSGEHYVALDHIRAIALFLVFTWHFLPLSHRDPIDVSGVPFFPFALLHEGHTGVALFMTLSGYLFAKLLNGKQIHYPAFFWNRFLRLVPLLGVVIALHALEMQIEGGSLLFLLKNILEGFMLPTLPNGGWSITTEFHFYLMLPLLLWLFRKNRAALGMALLAAIGVRTGMYLLRGEVQASAYWTIIGRIDQFVLGIMAFGYRDVIAKRHLLVGVVVTAFMVFYWKFDLAGGFYALPTYPSTSPIWVIMPTIEGLAYGVVIAYYDNSFTFQNRGFSRFLGSIGAYSYSVYLFHFFVVFRASAFINSHVMSLSNFYIACVWSVLCFVAMFPLGYLSFRFIESPFLKLRRRYVIQPQSVES